MKLQGDILSFIIKKYEDEKNIPDDLKTKIEKSIDEILESYHSDVDFRKYNWDFIDRAAAYALLKTRKRSTKRIIKRILNDIEVSQNIDKCVDIIVIALTVNYRDEFNKCCSEEILKDKIWGDEYGGIDFTIECLSNQHIKMYEAIPAVVLSYHVWNKIRKDYTINETKRIPRIKHLFQKNDRIPLVPVDAT